VAEILDKKEVVKHPDYKRLQKRTTQELKEEVSRLLTSPVDDSLDAKRLRIVITIISIMKERDLLSKNKLARLMTHCDERFAQQL
jgi:hypothetical protein